MSDFYYNFFWNQYYGIKTNMFSLIYLLCQTLFNWFKIWLAFSLKGIFIWFFQSYSYYLWIVSRKHLFIWDYLRQNLWNFITKWKTFWPDFQEFIQTKRHLKRFSGIQLKSVEWVLINIFWAKIVCIHMKLVSKIMK